MILTLDAVETIATDCLRASGASALQAGPVARSIRDAEAEGTRGIGLGYLPWYCGHLKVGKIAGDAVPILSRPAPGLVQVDAADGFSHPAFEAGEEALIQAAEAQGIALLCIANAYACGVLGYFTARLARRGLVALMFANASSTMAPWGGRRPFFGTNPWSMAAPRKGEPLILDSSSSATAYVNLAKAAASGAPLPPHWALDADGQPTTDAKRALSGTDRIDAKDRADRDIGVDVGGPVQGINGHGQRARRIDRHHHVLLFRGIVAHMAPGKGGPEGIIGDDIQRLLPVAIRIGAPRGAQVLFDATSGNATSDLGKDLRHSVYRLDQLGVCPFGQFVQHGWHDVFSSIRNLFEQDLRGGKFQGNVKM